MMKTICRTFGYDITSLRQVSLRRNNLFRLLSVEANATKSRYAVTKTTVKHFN